jgi:peptide/nickel transport system substrate-binding protein
MQRRDLLRGAAASAAGLTLPRIGRAQSATVMKFIPQADLASVDPIHSPALVTIMHGCAVFDMLYVPDDNYKTQPQMVEGHVIEDDGKTWKITLRDGLKFHDGSPVLARDCVASIQRWAKRDGLGSTLFTSVNELSAPTDKMFQFRLKKPFPLLPDALSKIGAYTCVIMPERLAQTAPTTQVSEVVGSGPYRFVANERVPGSLNVYVRNEAYVPRSSGTPSMLAGPKVAHFDRVEWHTIPEAATAAAAVQSGEMDWWDQATNDFLPALRKNLAVTVKVYDTTGFMAMIRPNSRQPPFNNPGVKRAVMLAIQQSDFLTAIAGEDHVMWHDKVGFFHPNSPFANDAGMEALTAPRDFDKAKRMLEAAGYKGERTVILDATDFPSLHAIALVGADTMKKLGLNVDLQATDWGTITQRFLSHEPVEKGGWSCWTNFMFGIAGINPANNNYIRGSGDQGMAGWPVDQKLEDLRAAWIDEPDSDKQKQICRDVQLECFQEVPHWPIGLFYQATVFRSSLQGVLNGMALMYNVKRV